jgi:hypothetical protein
MAGGSVFVTTTELEIVDIGGSEIQWIVRVDPNALSLKTGLEALHTNNGKY